MLSISEDLLHEAGSLANLLRWSAEDFSKIHGIGKVKALQLISVMQFAKRLLSEEVGQEVRFDNSAMIAQHFRHLAAGAEVEHFWVLCLDRKNRLLKRIEVTKGTATN